MGHKPADDLQNPHASAYYGLASIAISGIFLLMAVPALQLANTLQQSSYQGFSANDRQVAACAGYGGGGAVILMSLMAASMAITGIRSSGRTGEPAVLSTAGLLLSSFAVLVWIGCLAAWHSQAWSQLR